MVSTRIYKLILLLSVVIGVLVYGFGPGRFSPDFLIFFMGLLFALLLFIHTFVLLPLLCPDFLNAIH